MRWADVFWVISLLHNGPTNEHWLTHSAVTCARYDPKKIIRVLFETTELTDKTEDNLLHVGYIYRFQGWRNNVGNSGHYRTKIIFYWLDLGDWSKADPTNIIQLRTKLTKQRSLTLEVARDGVTLGITELWTSYIVRYSKKCQIAQRFGNWICFHPQVSIFSLFFEYRTMNKAETPTNSDKLLGKTVIIISWLMR
jgi:hypothetical protein